MRIVVWNCSMSLRKKLDAVLRLSPDIAVIGNAEFPDRLYPRDGGIRISGSLWFGTGRNCGLGVFSFGRWHIRPHSMHDPSETAVVPLECSCGDVSFLLVAAQGVPARGRTGYGQPFDSFTTAQRYISSIQGRTALFAGELGAVSPGAWSGEGVEGGFFDLERELAGQDLRSCYHSFTREPPGREKTPTFFEERDITRPAHTTWCFASTDLLLGLLDVQAGSPENWLDLGGHMPLVVDFA